MRRRRFLELTAGNLGGALLYSLDRELPHPQEPEKEAALHTRTPLRFFSESEAKIVAAAASRIFPSDETGPGAQEAGVVTYIDRQLAGPWGKDRYRYTHGPFDEGAAPLLGYQGKASPREIYREGLRKLTGFERLDPVEQDRVLHAMESSRFFELLRANTIEGMFCDPAHGGNAGMIGWRLIGFPGPRMSYAADVDQHYGKAFRPEPVTLQQVTGRKLSLDEDEGRAKKDL
jgi:gluconate 2-dehydrogenase gamma chain